MYGVGLRMDVEDQVTDYWIGPGEKDMGLNLGSNSGLEKKKPTGHIFWR